MIFFCENPDNTRHSIAASRVSLVLIRRCRANKIHIKDAFVFPQSCRFSGDLDESQQSEDEPCPRPHENISNLYVCRISAYFTFGLMSLKAITILPGAVKGNLTANASKSMMQRVVAASTLCDQKVTIHNPGQSHDCKAALEIARKLGAEIISGDPLSIEPRKGQIPRRVSCGESGLGIRMFTPILSLQNQSITIDGEGSLKTRPMGFFEEVLPQLGVSVESNNQKVPITIHGPLQGGDFELDGSLTSQFLTGLLMALPCAESSSTIRVKNLRSKGYVELTLQVLSSFGVIIDHENWEVFHVPGNQSYQSNAITIEGDWSGAAFLLVAGAIAGEVSLSSLVVNSFQPDKAILSALISSGARLKVGDIVSTFKSELEAFSFDATDCPGCACRKLRWQINN